MTTKIAIFCSGSGSNAQKILEHFQGSKTIEIAVLMSNKHDAYALKRAENFNIPTFIFDKSDFYSSTRVFDALKKYNVDWVILAGFLWLIPEILTANFPEKIINIHPALLPKYGGKGMYGMHVHKAVVEKKEKESGMTIHFVNAKYDDGAVIFQAKTPIEETDSPEEVAIKVLALEHRHYPEVIEEVIKKAIEK